MSVGGNDTYKNKLVKIFKAKNVRQKKLMLQKRHHF